MEIKEVTLEYLDFINEDRRHPAEVIFEMKKRIGTWEFKEILMEAKTWLMDNTEPQQKHKSLILIIIFSSLGQFKFRCP